MTTTAEAKRRERLKAGARLAADYARALEQGLRVPEPRLLRELREEATRPAGETADRERMGEFIRRKRWLESVVFRRVGRQRMNPHFWTTLRLPRGDGAVVRYRYWPATGKTEILGIEGEATA